MLVPLSSQFPSVEFQRKTLILKWPIRKALTLTQWVDLQVGEVEIFIEVEEAHDETSQHSRRQNNKFGLEDAYIYLNLVLEDKTRPHLQKSIQKFGLKESRDSTPRPGTSAV